MLVCSVQIIGSRLDSQSKFQMFTLFSGRHVVVHQHGGSIPGYLCKIFRQTSEVYNITISQLHPLKGSRMIF